MALKAQVKVSAVDRPKTLTRASQQWRERPADECFETLDALLAATRGHHQRAVQVKKPFHEIRVTHGTNDEIYLVGQGGKMIRPNHWAFGQLCQRVGAPASYLRELPAHLAVENLRHGLEAATDEEAAVLLVEKPEQSGDIATLRAMTSDKYTRVWNDEVAEALVALRERAPSWQFPEPFRTVGGTKANAWGKADGKQIPIAFASDHDMFVFLCDYEHGIDVGGSVLARGFFVENSEVGDASFKVTMFLFDFVCSNILVWGARNVAEIKFKHVGAVRDRVLARDSKVLKAINDYSNLRASEQTSQILNAQNVLIGKDDAEVLSTLFGRKSLQLAKGDIQAAQLVANTTPRYGNPRSVWAIVNGLTEVSQRTTYTDQRIKLDRAAGSLLETFAF
jgi:hypothetical protein